MGRGLEYIIPLAVRRAEWGLLSICSKTEVGAVTSVYHTHIPSFHLHWVDFPVRNPQTPLRVQECLGSPAHGSNTLEMANASASCTLSKEALYSYKQ